MPKQRQMIQPFVKAFPDYHDIDYDLKIYQDLVPNMKAVEIGFDYNYWGLFYTGRKPSKNAIKQLLKDANFGFDYEGYGWWYKND